MKDEGRTALLVSHDTALLSHLCARLVLLDAGTVRADGPVDTVIQRYRAL